MKFFATGVGITLLTMACSLSIAQEPANRNDTKDADQRSERQERRAERAKRREQGRMTHADKVVLDYFAGRLMLMDQGTIELAKMAEQRSSNPQVRQFAESLIDEHTECRQKLQERAPGVVDITDLSNRVVTRKAGYRGDKNSDDESDAVDDPAKAAKDPSRNPDGTEKIVGNGPVDPDGVDGHKQMHGNVMIPVHRILAIDRQATDNYVQSATNMLKEFEGADFDMGFLGFTIGSHTWALSELKAMDAVGDEEFRKLISDATSRTERHLATAQKLSEQFEKDVAQRGNTSQSAGSAGQTQNPQ